MPFPNSGYKIGDTVAEMTYGGFSQWGISKSKLLLPVPTCAPEIIGLLTGGLTASIGKKILQTFLSLFI